MSVAGSSPHTRVLYYAIGVREVAESLTVAGLCTEAHACTTVPRPVQPRSSYNARSTDADPVVPGKVVWGRAWQIGTAGLWEEAHVVRKQLAGTANGQLTNEKASFQRRWGGTDLGAVWYAQAA